MSTSRQLFTATIASGADSASVDFGQQTGYRRVYANNEATAEIAIQGSGDGENYYQIQLKSGTTAAAWSDLDIGSASSGNLVELPPLPRYIKVVATGTVANGGSVYFVTA